MELSAPQVVDNPNPYNKPDACLGCPLLREPGPTWADGPPTATTLQMAEAPGKHESIPGPDGIRHPLVGPTGRYYDTLNKRAGVQRNDIRVGNSVACFPPEKIVNGKKERPVTKEMLAACKVHRDRLLARMPNLRHIHLMGKWAARAFLGEKAAIDAWQGARVRRCEIDPGIEFGAADDYTLTFSLHPARALRDRMQLPILQDQFHRAARAGMDSLREPRIIRRGIHVFDADLPAGHPSRQAWGGVTVWPFGPDTLEKFFPATGLLFFDTETTGPVDEYRIERISLATVGGYALTVKWSAKVREWLRPLFEDPGILKVAHNLQFDNEVMRRAKIRVAKPIFCTMTALAILMPDLPNSLEYGMMISMPADYIPWKFTSDSDPQAYSGVDSAVLGILYEWEQERLTEGG